MAEVLGPLEAEVMEELWAATAPMSVRAVLDQLNQDRTPDLAYTTVMTVLSRLAEKGILLRDRDGRGFVYRPALPDAASIAVRGVVRDFGEAAVAGFVDEARADPRLLRRLQKLLNEPS
ncbi:MAG TPA: BlaI/MecI/CopY family transcriptional regulator [Acidimicrobiales bacterium]|jgi:predicted transcriptional regulator